MSCLVIGHGALTVNELLFLQQCSVELEREHSVDVHNRLFDDNGRCVLCLLGSVCVPCWMKKMEGLE
jgi:hypothetical protein